LTQLRIPITSREQQDHLSLAQDHLNAAGVHFDSGSDLVDGTPVTRVWELGHSLEGAEMKGG